jgi:hypothetical protein
MAMEKKKGIIQEILRVKTLVSPTPLTMSAFKRNSQISLSTIRYQFGSFNRAVAEAGLTPNKSGVPVSGYKTLSEEELLVALGDVWRQMGKRPSESEMNAYGKYSSRPYRKRWATFRNAVDAYVARFGEPDGTALLIHPTVTASAHSQSSVVIPKIHRPKTGRDVPRILYGEPLDFRGLRYAPVNEQGVVYLFGMVSRELGFLIESIRTDYPDCEGKRCLNAQGTQWEHVRIEFELKSSNFLEHGHDPVKCDLIVCWTHDCGECPIEVLELKTELKKLRRE